MFAQVAVDKGLFRMAPTPKAGPCLNTILQTALEIAEGLAFLHSCCVVHCDLSAGAPVLLSQCSACSTPVSVPVRFASHGPFCDVQSVHGAVGAAGSTCCSLRQLSCSSIPCML